MILERAMQPDWLSNTYLVAGDRGSDAVLIDAGGPVEALLENAATHDLRVTHVLLTHHHHDHVAELARVRERFPDAAVLIHPLEADQVEGARALDPGEPLRVGELEIESLHTPGHTAGMVAFVVNGSDVFTGDTLFKGSVGGVRAPGATGYEDLRSSIMDVLMKLGPTVRVRPGHSEPTTIGEEWERNPFIRVWRHLDDEGADPCIALGEPATLVLLGPDYDGGHKAWVRWPDGRDDIVPGSTVQRVEEADGEPAPEPADG